MNYQKPDLPGSHGVMRAVRETIHTLLMVIAIYTLVNLAIPRYAVEGRSMQPSFNGEGDERVIVNRLEYLLRDPERGDIIVLNNPNGNDHYIKRIIGLPGDHLQMIEGKIYINDQPLEEPYIKELCSKSHCREQDWHLGPTQYFVLGDNRNNSHDSGVFGPIDRSKIIGRAWIRYWPPEEWNIFSHYDYANN